MSETDNEDARTEGEAQFAPIRDLRAEVLASAGQAQEEVRAERPGSLMGRGARVTLRRFNGEYQLLRGNTVIQSFCSDFERITQFSLPDGIQQQVRISISPVGPAREIPAEDPPGEYRDDPGVELRSTAHPNTLQLNQESLERLEVEIPERADSSNWRNYAREQLRQEIQRIGDVIDMIDRLDMM